MKPGPLALACLLVCAALPARADVGDYSHLGQPVRFARHDNADLLAQRTIDREWGPAEDSTYRVVDVPGWKSEGLALALSAAVPGTGHLYLGENSGWWYVLAEAAFWTGHWYEGRQARREWSDLESFVGNPYDSTATFSFARYTQASHHDTQDLERLWHGDRNAFYRELDDNPAYVGGFAPPSPEAGQLQMHDLIDSHDSFLNRQGAFDAALWANHLISALDAWRIARAHNAPLRQQYHIELAEGRRGGEREVRLALVRRF